VAVVTVRYWAGAKQVAGCASEQLEATTIADVRARLAGRPRGGELSAAVSFLADGVAATDTTALRDDDIVDVLPPFAGG
jgi:molybdopterin converting factor small subunit